MGLAVAAAAVTAPAVAGADYETTAESWTCGPPRFYPPAAGSIGDLPDDHVVRGPAGGLFGRTIGAVEDRLVWWTVPMSDGARVRVHELLMPSLQRVEENLAEAAASGRHYQVRAAFTSSFVARTSRSHDRISYHGLGAAIDINSHTNPYRLDGVLETDMPAWFVEAWEDAGFCWGGSWDGVKDAMHFSWMGPAASPGFSGLPAPLSPLTAPTDFRDPVDRREVVLEPGATRRFVADVSGDGAPDVAQLRETSSGAGVLEVATSQRGYLECSVWTWPIDSLPDARPDLADVEGVGRPDLVFVDGSGDTLTMIRHRVMTGYQAAPRLDTAVPVHDGERYLFGDVDRDGADDLFVVAAGDEGAEVDVWSAVSGFTARIRSGVVAGLEVPSDARLSSTDRDQDGRDELVVVGPGSGSSTLTFIVPGATEVSEILKGPGLTASDSIGMVDHDGDGRDDVVVAGAGGDVEAWLGNTRLAGSTSAWFVPDDFECRGRFVDDDDSVYEADIEWLAGEGITKGCNPPRNDWFCPEEAVTRGQMAAFLVRALGLEAASNGFVDDEGSVFEADIGALAGAGVTKGCNPPRNDWFCPDDPVTRGQMAAFLHRAADHFGD